MAGVTNHTYANNDRTVTGRQFGVGNGARKVWNLAGMDSDRALIHPVLYKIDWGGIQQYYSTARTNLLVNSVLAGGGSPPTSWTAVVGTGTPSTSTLGSGYTAYSFTASGNQRIYNQAVTLEINTTYCFSVLVESVTGTIPATDALFLVTPLAGATVTFPVCSANPSGGAGGTLTTGTLICTIAVAATGGTQNVRIGCGCLNNATGTIKTSHPQCEVGTARTSFIPTTTAAVTVTDYSTAATGVVTFASAPPVGTQITYKDPYSSNGYRHLGLGDGSATLFSLPFAYVAPSIYVNGALQTLTTHYSVSPNGDITFVSAPADTAILTWTGNMGHQR